MVIKEAIQNLKHINEDRHEIALSRQPNRNPFGISKIDGDINERIIKKLVSIAQAVEDETGLDAQGIFADMVSDLRLINGDKLLSVLDGGTPLEQATKEMAEVGRELHLDSNLALNALLQMDEKACVEATKHLLSSGVQELPVPHRQGIPFAGRRMIESLSKKLLLEGENLDKIYTKYYTQALPKKDFLEIIKLDPTFSEEEDKLGSYGQWLLKRVRKGDIKKPDYRQVTEILNDFNDRKRFLQNEESKGPGKEANKGIDINAYKNLKEIRDALNCIQLTRNQIANLNRKAKHHTDLGDEAEFIFENDKWEVWSPKTYNASCKLGSGSTWCTASTSSDHWYNHYANDGKLYIFIDKTGKDDKIQLHINKNGKVTDFKEGKTDAAWHRKYNDEFEGFLEFIDQEGIGADIMKTEIGKSNAGALYINKKRLERGEPYLYNGAVIPAILKDSIKKIVFEDGYEPTELRRQAFSGLHNLEEVTLPNSVSEIGFRAFNGCPDNTVVYILPGHPKKYSANQDDIEWLRKHMAVKKAE